MAARAEPGGLIDDLVPGPSTRRRLVILLALATAWFVLVTVPSGSVQRWWNDRRHAGHLDGAAVALDDNPLGNRAEVAVTTIDGGRVFMWGGRGFAGGVIYDPASTGFTPVAAPAGPLRFGPAAGWTGTEVVVWGGRLQNTRTFPTDASAYSPASGTWRPLPDAPLGGAGARSVSYPDGILFTGGFDPSGDSLWFDWRAETWQRIPTPLRVLTIVTVDGRTFAAGPTGPRRPGRLGRQGWVVGEFDAARRSWSLRTGPYVTDWLAPLAHGSHLEVVALDDAGNRLRVLRWDGERWARVTETHHGARWVQAIEPDGYPPVAAWTGSSLVVGGMHGLAAYDPERERFRSMVDNDVSSFGSRAVWTGTQLVATPGQGTSGWSFAPAAP